jgi:hypothetical protein
MSELDKMYWFSAVNSRDGKVVRSYCKRMDRCARGFVSYKEL